jgi:ABC-type transport system substrate-binding protein
VSSPNYRTDELLFNQHAGRVTQDQKVRLALMTAIDPKTWLKVAYGTHAVWGPSEVFPTLACFDKNLTKLLPSPSITKAQQILVSDGYTLNSSTGLMEKNGKSLRVQLVTNADIMASGGEYIANQWKLAGVSVDLLNFSGSLYGLRYVGENWDTAVGAHVTLTSPLPDTGYSGVSGAPPPKGLNRGLIGGGNQDWERAALYAQQTTGCSWLTKLQELTYTKSILYPLGFRIPIDFGGPHWAIPLAANFSEPEWITSTGK